MFIMSYLLEKIAPLCSKSLERTKCRGYAKGYLMIAMGKIKLPESIRYKMGQITIAVVLISTIQDVLKVIFSKG